MRIGNNAVVTDRDSECLHLSESVVLSVQHMLALNLAHVALMHRQHLGCITQGKRQHRRYLQQCLRMTTNAQYLCSSGIAAGDNDADVSPV